MTVDTIGINDEESIHNGTRFLKKIAITKISVASAINH
tara:strand:+ start:6476 stop:6589 length:114 start_codon:yes stop_codon:yes gene_type:complete